MEGVKSCCFEVGFHLNVGLVAFRCSNATTVMADCHNMEKQLYKKHILLSYDLCKTFLSLIKSQRDTPPLFIFLFATMYILTI